MKKLILFLSVFLPVVTLAAQSSGSSLFVAAKTVDVKSSSGFFSSVVGTLKLGEEVKVVQPGEKWVVIRGAAGLQGYAPADAFSRRRIINTGGSVSSTEFAMAGKGFTGDLERLISSSGAADYSGVDAMEKRTVSPEELRAFLQEGRLASGE